MILHGSIETESVSRGFGDTQHTHILDQNNLHGGVIIGGKTFLAVPGKTVEDLIAEVSS